MLCTTEQQARPHAETHCIAWNGDAVLLLPIYSSTSCGRFVDVTGTRMRASLTRGLFALARFVGALRCRCQA
jgi:hypothetical protein